MRDVETRLARALGAAADGMAVPVGRLEQVMTRGAHRRRWVRIAAGASGLVLAVTVAAATGWAMGGTPPPAGAPDLAVTETTETTETTEANVVGTSPADPATTATTGPIDPAAPIGTAPPTTSPTGDTDPGPPTTAPVTVGTPPTTTSPDTRPPVATTSAIPQGVALAACPAHGTANDDFGVTRASNRIHMGIDIVAPTGTPVYAVAAGRVDTATGPLTGNAIDLTGDDGVLYVYTHLDALAPGIDDGRRVTPGQQLGTVGETGYSDGPLLHFEVRPHAGEAVDPYDAVRAACG